MPKNPNPTSKTTRPSFQNDVASVTSPLADVAVNETEGCIRSGPKIRFGLEMLLQILNWFRSVKVTALLLLLFSSALLRLFFPCSFSSRRWCSFGEEGHKPCSAALLLGAGSENRQKTVEPDENRPVGPNRNPAGLHKKGCSFVSFSLSPFLSFRQRNHSNPTTKPLHCNPAPPPRGVAYCRRPSHSKFAIRHLASLVLQIFNPCSLSPIAVASSSSASVVFPRVRRRLFAVHARVFVRVLRRSRSLGVHRSRSLAVHRSSSRSSGSHVALLQTLRPTRALHSAIGLLAFVPAVSSLNPPPDNTLRQHQYSSSNSATSDFYYRQHGRMKLETESLKDVKCNDGKEKEKIVDSANSNFNSGNDRTFHPIKKFVMQSYFDRHIELHDSVFDNFMSQEDNVGLCQVLPKNHDFVPRLSVLKRELIGEGSHRHVSTLLKFQARRSESSSQLLSSSCDFIIIERLPTGVFADPFELQRLVQRGVFNDVDVFGDTNLELPSFLSNRSAVEIHLVVDPNKFLEPTDIKIELPLHARYQPLNESGYSTVELGMPDILVRCSTKERSENQNYFFKLTNNDADVMYEADVLWRIPSGKKAHSNLVFVITFSAALLSTLVIVLSSLEYSKSRVRKDSKQS
ncbi:hypothetical protein Ahy_A06g030659 isoform B [Arachis hypogaea]|uniref:Phosphatidylinositol-glycan biosynthesis class X protein n=1 Tax=Arachis hypogaea TaxID=3818 RepID=A0A445CX05_ARAHY|nr:hypothetical protein Ahy_A06g030659 isoform B [Arachis hypogaea]